MSLVFLTLDVRCVILNIAKMPWRHRSVMGVTGAGDGASAPLPPDGHIPPPASSSDPAQQFRQNFLASKHCFGSVMINFDSHVFSTFIIKEDY